MIGDLESKQILTLAAQGASVSEIAAALSIEEGLVNLVLSAHGEADARDITNEQLAFLRQRAFVLAMQSEDLSVASRMTQFLIERDKPSKVAQGPSPITAINNAIILANEQFAKLKETYENSH